MKRATFLPLVASALLLVTSAFAAAPNAPQGKSDEKSPAGSTDSVEQEKREKAFSEKLTGATLVGHFTVNDREGQREERYEITSAKKLAGEMWVITARVKYGQRDVTVPIPLPVRWAGDTPVICLTDLTIPNLGTYTARVLFYGDQYAGTWSAGADHGGHLWGRIEKAGAAPKAEGAGEKPAGGAGNAK